MLSNFANQDYSAPVPEPESELRSPMSPNPQSAAIKDEMRRRSWVVDSLRAQFEDMFREQEVETSRRQAVEQEYEDRGFNNLVNHNPNNDASQNHMENIQEEDEMDVMQEKMKNAMSTLKEIRRRSQFFQLPDDFPIYGDAQTMEDASEENVYDQPNVSGQHNSELDSSISQEQEYARQAALQHLGGMSHIPSLPLNNTQQHYSSFNEAPNAEMDLASLQAAISSPSISRAVMHNPNVTNPQSTSKVSIEYSQQPQNPDAVTTNHYQHTDDEYQIFATKEQAEQFRIRRMELARDADQIERERLWRMTGGLGILGNGSQAAPHDL